MSILNLIDGDVSIYDWFGSTAPTVGQKTMANSIPVVLSSDQSNQSVNVHDGVGNAITSVVDGSYRRLHVAVQSTTTSSLTTVVDQLKNAGSPSMRVDGSVTPVEFTYNADATYDITLIALRFALSTGTLDWNGAGFGDGGILTNGMLVQVTVNNGTTLTLANIQLNEDFTRLSDVPMVTQAGATDHMVCSFQFSGTLTLKAGTGDNLKVTIRDNLALSARDVKYLTATFQGNMVI